MGRRDGADLILHAGDVCVPAVLEELSAFVPAPVNKDHLLYRGMMTRSCAASSPSSSLR